jgi:hypothetical protein
VKGSELLGVFAFSSRPVVVGRTREEVRAETLEAILCFVAVVAVSGTSAWYQVAHPPACSWREAADTSITQTADRALTR